MNWGELSQLDAQLAALATVEGALRLRLGQALEVLGRGGHHELGFSSLAAYALERCERSLRWVEAARSLARRLETLPQLRRSVAAGVVSWSMGEVLGRAAQPESEAAWIEAAQGCTVRKMRARVSAALGGAAPARADAASADAASADAASADAASAVAVTDDDEKCTLTVTIDREEAWLFEATRALLEQLGTYGRDEQLEALLAEGQDTLFGALPRGAIDAEALPERDVAQLRWNAELARFRAQAEARCEERIRQQRAPTREGPPEHGATILTQGADAAVVAAATLGCGAFACLGSREIDVIVRQLSRRLARQELELARRILKAASSRWLAPARLRHRGSVRSRTARHVSFLLCRPAFLGAAPRAAAGGHERAGHFDRRRSGFTDCSYRNAEHRAGMGSAGGAPHRQAPA